MRMASALALLGVLAGAATRADRVDDAVRADMAARHIPGLSLAVVRGGKVTKAAAYGFANLEWSVRATTETVYQLQSVTKQFTATAVMMLVEEGRVGLDDPVSRYLEGTPASWAAVTVRRLLTHTSGIKDFINEPTADLRLDVTEEEVLRAAASRPLNFAPGERYAYSNTNYHLLAMILRKVTGQAWSDFVHERILRPLDMRDTRLVSLADIVPRRASGYLWEGGKLRNGRYVAPSILGYAGGGLMSTVLDMAKWDAALYTEKLLKQSALRQMWTPTKLTGGGASDYGFGWAVGSHHGHPMVTHSGAHSTGFTTAITRFPDDRLTVIVLTNQAYTADPSAIALRVAGMVEPALALPPSAPIVERAPPAAPAPDRR
ncbi:MAG: beta-lactamase family protein [Chthonomonadales bacterium]|nr:beta-lactamase family protein [Chthonomonadales bacterium]